MSVELLESFSCDPFPLHSMYCVILALGCRIPSRVACLFEHQDLICLVDRPSRPCPIFIAVAMIFFFSWQETSIATALSKEVDYSFLLVLPYILIGAGYETRMAHGRHDGILDLRLVSFLILVSNVCIQNNAEAVAYTGTILWWYG